MGKQSFCIYVFNIKSVPIRYFKAKIMVNITEDKPQICKLIKSPAGSVGLNQQGSNQTLLCYTHRRAEAEAAPAPGNNSSAW